MDSLLTETLNYVRFVCQQFQIDDTHGLNHAITVKDHIKNTIMLDKLFNLNQKTQIELQMTGLLHDIDDHKYFPIGSHNAQNFLTSHCDTETSLRILKWISFISASKNGNNVPVEAIEHPWVLWPRYCDRIEAVGKTGIERVIEYSRLRCVPDYQPTTPRAVTYEDVMSYVIPQRFDLYIQNNGVSASSIDHIYDKLLHICDVETYSPYINQKLLMGKKELIEVCINYGKYGKIMC